MAGRKKKIAYVRCRGGSVSCTFGCIGCRACVSACRLGAIKMDTMFPGDSVMPPVVDEEKCVGCGLCALACPQSIIEIIIPSANIQVKCSNKETAAAAKGACVNSCVACRMCERNCPAEAIKVTDNIAVIDPAKCICCGMCAVKCPRDVIRDAFNIITD